LQLREEQDDQIALFRPLQGGAKSESVAQHKGQYVWRSISGSGRNWNVVVVGAANIDGSRIPETNPDHDGRDARNGALRDKAILIDTAWADLFEEMDAGLHDLFQSSQQFYDKLMPLPSSGNLERSQLNFNWNWFSLFQQSL